MERFVNISTEFGRLYGRDCIFLDRTEFENNKLILEGEINGALAGNKASDEWIPYRLIFKSVIAYFSCELDTYENLSRIDGCFGIVEESEHLKRLPVRIDFDKSEYKHYKVCTYDYVFDIFAKDFELGAGIKRGENR